MFDFSKWTNENAFSLITIFLAIIGGGFAYLQYRRSVKLQRAEFVNMIVDKLRFNEKLVLVKRMVESTPWYNEEFHHGAEWESEIDAFFAYLSYICYLIQENIISKNEAKALEYTLSSTISRPQTQEYLWNLYWWSQRHKVNCSFQCLIDYGLSNNFISKDKFNEDSEAFRKYI
jgi:hypothetical protein